MGLISTVGRKSWAVRLLVLGIYLVLLAGAVTMVYPFLVMISGSFTTNVDRYRFDVFPAFVHDGAMLFRKHLECKYNNSLPELNNAWGGRELDFELIQPPARVPGGRVDDWRQFELQAGLTPSLYHLGYMQHFGDRLRLWKHREFRARLMAQYEADVDAYRARYGLGVENFDTLGSVVERVTERRYQLAPTDAFEVEYYDFKQAQPAWFRIHPNLDQKFVAGYLQAVYPKEIAEYNKTHQTSCGSYDEISLSRRAPKAALERQDWERLVREELNLQYVRVDDAALPAFGEFLRQRYAGELTLLNRRYGTGWASFAQAAWPADYMHSSDRLVDYAEFVKNVAPAERLHLVSPAFTWRDWLRERYAGDLAALNRAHEAAYGSFESVPIPARELDYADFLANADAIRAEHLTANYRQVLDYILLRGRSLWNTVVYCFLAIALSLTVDPLAAYALSRYKLASTYKILLFCMATMAFPAAVTMIPNFLLLKELNLLNSFWALLLPGMANGFSIFLLKGFFDSLPRELYESAALDGAGEWTMFWNLTMALSKPILAVMALNAFTAAYGNFMFAFVLCPDEKMWTLMVFLYQLQVDGHTGLTFAALLVAAVPTFLVFVLCQNIIIRGIVVPVEK